MKKRYKITGGFLAFLAVFFIVLGITLSYNSDCPAAPEVAENSELMSAAVFRCYGSADVINIEKIAKPIPADNEVVVKVHVAGVNPLDWHYMQGAPYIMRLMSGVGAPDNTSMGVDFAGVVDSVGSKVTKFKPGDQVFGGRSGAYGDYVAVPEDKAITLKPNNISFEQAAAVPIAAVTALQALRNKGEIKAGQKVLINGASGGVGSFAVQIAKSFGAEVTGVCSTRNLDLVKSLGADFVIDYKNEDYTQSGKHYDLIIDMVGNHSLLKNREALTAKGTLVAVGENTDNWFGPLVGPIAGLLLSPFVEQEFKMFVASLNQEDMVFLAGLMEAGKLTSRIDKRFTLNEVADAMRYSESGRTRGKSVVVLQ